MIGVVQDGRGYFKTAEDKQVILCLRGRSACNGLCHQMTAPAAGLFFDSEHIHYESELEYQILEVVIAP